MYVNDSAGNTVEINSPPIQPYEPGVEYVTDTDAR